MPRKQAPLTSLITDAEWDRICDVYRRHGGAHQSVANELGWTKARMHRVWKRGYPSQNLPPIMHSLGMDPESVEEIRARRNRLIKEELPPSEPVSTIEEVETKAVVIHTREQQRIQKLMRIEEDRRHAREDALAARAEEATLISITRQNALALNGATARLMKGALALSEKIQEGLEKEARDGSLSVKESLALVRSAASVARFNSETTMLAIKSERMVLGQPIDTDPEHHVDDGTLEQSVEWIERAASAIEKARARGLLMSENLKEQKA